jgi:hypothetical protein
MFLVSESLEWTRMVCTCIVGARTDPVAVGRGDGTSRDQGSIETTDSIVIPRFRDGNFPAHGPCFLLVVARRRSSPIAPPPAPRTFLFWHLLARRPPHRSTPLVLRSSASDRLCPSLLWNLSLLLPLKFRRESSSSNTTLGPQNAYFFLAKSHTIRHPDQWTRT